MLGRPAADRGGALSIRRNSTSCSWRVLASSQDNDNSLLNKSEIAHVRSCSDVAPKILPLAVAAALASLMPSARAEADATASPGASTAGDPAIVLGGVTVSGRSSGVLKTRQVLTSVDILGADRIEDRNVAQSWELLGLLPGIQLTETRMGAESGKPTFRAFNGEATSTASRC